MALSVKNMLGGSGGGASPFAWGKYAFSYVSDDSERPVPNPNNGNLEMFIIRTSTTSPLPMYCADSYTITEDGKFSLDSPQALSVTSGSYTVPDKYYMYDNSIGDTMYKGGSKDTSYFGTMSGVGWVLMDTVANDEIRKYKVATQVEFLEYVTDKNPLKYPNGEIADDGFFYRYANEGLYVWDKNEVVSTPYDFYIEDTNNYAQIYEARHSVAINGKCYALVSVDVSTSPYHYQLAEFDGDDVTIICEVPYTSAVSGYNYFTLATYNNELYLVGDSYRADTNHTYKWNGSTWVDITTAPYRTNGQACLVEFGGYLHIFSSGVSTYGQWHYRFNGTAWEQVSTAIGYNFYGSKMFYHDDILHCIGGSNGYQEYDYQSTDGGATWSRFSISNQVGGCFIDAYSSIYLYDGHYYVICRSSSATSGTALKLLRHESGGTWSNIPLNLKTSPLTSTSVCVLQIKDNGKYIHFTRNNYKDGIEYTKGDYIDTIITDTASAYPDDGKQGDYYYIKSGATELLDCFGCTKMAIDEIMVTSDTVLTGQAFDCSLGETPKATILLATTNLSTISGGYISSAFGRYTRLNPASYYTDTWTDKAIGYSYDVSISYNATTGKINLSRYSSSYSTGLKANVLYKLITMA